jgi:UDP-glucose 4-epimerase
MAEELPTSATNPYGWTKVMIEQILRDVAGTAPDWRIALMRYFNPVGAHPSGTIGEDPAGEPNNLLPYIAQVAVGRLEKLRIFGDDYDTPDGTPLRDYIHVEDLAAGHIASLAKLGSTDQPVSTWNLGTGRGSSVFDMLRAFERAVGRSLPYEVVSRRPGDIAASYADPARANAELGWTATRTIDDMCADAWRWQSQNPNGYPDA